MEEIIVNRRPTERHLVSWGWTEPDKGPTEKLNDKKVTSDDRWTEAGVCWVVGVGEQHRKWNARKVVPKFSVCHETNSVECPLSCEAQSVHK